MPSVFSVQRISIRLVCVMPQPWWSAGQWSCTLDTVPTHSQNSPGSPRRCLQTSCLLRPLPTQCGPRKALSTPSETRQAKEMRLTEGSQPPEGRYIDLHGSKRLNDIVFCYLKCCPSNSIMEGVGPGPGSPRMRDQGWALPFAV